VTALLATAATSDCGITSGSLVAWQASHQLDDAAQRWALGSDLSEAVDRSGYVATAVSGLRFYGLDSPERPRLGASSCSVLRNAAWTDFGAFRRGADLWIVLAASTTLPGDESAASMHRRALSLVNAARAQGQHCGSHSLPPAPPVRMSAQLSEIAREHALDMARHRYFDHQDLSGRSPADRVRAAGYRVELVGENIAYGTLSIEDAIGGWLKSPGHCENVLDPRYKEMGIGFAEQGSEGHDVYWVQVLADPR
jgi:uncharacterized protein YkwD